MHRVDTEKTKEHINKNDMNKYLVRSLQNLELKKIKKSIFNSKF